LAQINLNAVPVGHFLFNGTGKEGQIDWRRRSQGVRLRMGELGFRKTASGFQAMLFRCGKITEVRG